MKNYIIKAAGKPAEIVTALQTLKNIIGEGATLSDVVTLKRFTDLKRITDEQFKTEV